MKLTQTKVIDGVEITVQQLPPRRATRLLIKIAGYIAPALGEVAPSLKGGLAGADVSALGVAVGRLAKDLGPDEFDALTNEILEQSWATVGGKRQELLRVIDAVFQGKPFGIFQSVVFALEVNYGNFSDALRGALGEQAVPTDQG
jgi:hypothetical protein